MTLTGTCIMYIRTYLCVLQIFSNGMARVIAKKNNNASTDYKYTRVTTIVITKVRIHYEQESNNKRYRTDLHCSGLFCRTQ